MKRVLKKSKVISLTGKMSRSDKRVAARLRAPNVRQKRCPATKYNINRSVATFNCQFSIVNCQLPAFSLAEKVGNSPANCSDKGFVAQATKNAAVATAAFQPFFSLFRHYTKANASIYKNSRKKFPFWNPMFLFYVIKQYYKIRNRKMGNYAALP